MRYALISDIHGNLEALEAVLKCLASEDIDEYICAGDIVGYGANPRECIEAVRSIDPKILVAGNHEWGVLGLLDIDYFSENAAAAIIWAKGVLERGELEYLKSFKLSASLEDFTVVHGSLEEPARFNYVLDGNDARRTIELLKTPLCFVGHTHIPGIFYYDEDRVVCSEGPALNVDRSRKYVINIGSVGQPRDGDRRAGFAIYDTGSGRVEIRRIDYNFERAQYKILGSGLPQRLAERLAEGR